MSRTISISIALILLICAALCAGCTAPVQDDQKTPAPSQTAIPQAVHVFCGAGLKAPMQEIGAAFTEKYGIPVEFNYGGGGTLVSQMNLTRKGDVFMPGSTVEWHAAKSQGLVNDYELVAYHVPVIIVQKGNPEKIASLNDLARPGLEVALGDSSATAIGKAGGKMFKKLNITDDVEKNVVTRTPTINELVVIMKTGQADAAIVTLDNVDTAVMDAITIPVSENEILVTPIGMTTYTTNTNTAAKFIAFVASDEGKAFFAKHGFPVYPDPAYANISV
jgi:molybdate transport system substrate-binding protein